MFDEREEMLRRESIVCEAAYASGLVSRPTDYVKVEGYAEGNPEQVKDRNNRIAVVSSFETSETIEEKLLIGKGELRRTEQIVALLKKNHWDSAVELITKEFLE